MMRPLNRAGWELGIGALALSLCALAGCQFIKPKAADAPNPPLVATSGASSAAKPSGASEATGTFAFRDVTRNAGIVYRWKLPNKPTGNILDLIGNGAAFLDYDNDGNLDILLVGGYPLGGPALYKGDGKGNFAPAPLPPLSGRFLGCATGDFDRDGFTDIYLTAYRGGALLHNQGGKGFADVTKTSGIALQPWGTSASFGDFDGDGNLDLFIGNYVQFGPNTVPQLCQQKGIETACAPRQYPPERSTLYKGDGKGHFVDITQSAGFDKLAGKALGVAVADYDDSGRLSVAIANDEMPGDLMKNRGGGKFENIAKLAGTATDNDGNVHGGMGTDWADVNGDGRLDLFVATYQNEVKNVYVSDGDDLFTDRGDQMGLISASPLVSFGIRFADFDNDGHLDLIIANGHIQDNIAKIDARTTFRQPTVFYRGTDGKTFTEITASLDKAVTRPIVGRGVAAGDYDNDGRIDFLVVDSAGSPLLLHNETSSDNHWLGIELSDASGNSPLGANVLIVAGGRTQVRRYHSDGSYMSASDPRLIFGLGAATGAEKIAVRWPNGKIETWENLPADRYHRLTRGVK